MRGLYWKLGATALAGAAIGLFGGHATVAGMAAPPAPTLAERPYGSPGNGMEPDGYRPAYVGMGSSAAQDARIVDTCDDCSDYDLGFRFAAVRKVRETAECMEFSWSYQRGCLAWLHQG